MYNLIARDAIGVDVSGLHALPNGADGISITTGSNYNTIGGLVGQADPGNVISGNTQQGVAIEGTEGNELLGNNIGVAFDGLTRIPNLRNGVLLESDASFNLIGSAGLGRGNIISGNGGDGVAVGSPIQQNFATANEIDDNYIGVGGDGSTAVPNGQNGVEINSVVDTKLINDVISGNTLNGVDIYGPGIDMGISVSGCMIGTNAAGTAAVANGNDGVLIASSSNTIGASFAGAQPSNVISGNNNYGIEITRGSSNLVLKDFIGTDAAGMVAIGNTMGGVFIGLDHAGNNSTNNTIGGLGGQNTRDIISGNGAKTNTGTQGCGVIIEGVGNVNNLVEGDYIGVDAAGLNPLGNANDGIYVVGGADGNTIGGAQAGAPNVISANGWLTGGDDYGVDIGPNANNNLIANNTIGLNAQGQDPNHNMANTAGWQKDRGTNNQWTNNQHQT
jgi:hypothetical protein